MRDVSQDLTLLRLDPGPGPMAEILDRWREEDPRGALGFQRWAVEKLAAKRAHMTIGEGLPELLQRAASKLRRYIGFCENSAYGAPTIADHAEARSLIGALRTVASQLK